MKKIRNWSFTDFDREARRVRMASWGSGWWKWRYLLGQAALLRKQQLVAQRAVNQYCTHVADDLPLPGEAKPAMVH